MKRRRNESGFALLLVFVMAAAISITLFIEVPRIAFESQRAKEQMTIDRGHQYVRAIQLFYRKYQTYPQNLDDLETTRNIRFLRHRYMDPLTGKEWRLLHVGPAGQLTDSLVQPPPPLPGSTTGSGPNSAQQGSSQGFGASQGFGSSQTANSAQTGNSSKPADPNNPNDPNAQPPDPLNMAARRPSDRIIGAGGAPGGGNAGGNGGEQPVPEPDPNQPQQPGQPVQQPYPGLPVQQPGDPNLPITPQDPSQSPTPGQLPVQGQPVFPQDPSQQTPQPLPVGFPPGIAPPAPGSTPTPQPTANTPTPAQMSPFGQGFGPGQSGVPGQPGAPGQAGGQQQSAASIIQSILTTPRQPPSSIAAFTSGNTGGIAGVASTADGKGIHVINDRRKYKEWEFIYDLKKDKTVVGAGAVNQQQQMQTQMQQNQNGNGPLGGNSSFGSNSTSSSPFSSTPANSPSPTGGSPTPTAPPPSQ